MNKDLVLTGDEDFDSMLLKCIEVMRVKSVDYTIGTGDKLHNFKTVAAFMNTTPEQVLGVYLYKHISALYAYIKNGGQSESEPIDGRIADIINYMLLFNKMVNEKRPLPSLKICDYCSAILCKMGYCILF